MMTVPRCQPVGPWATLVRGDPEMSNGIGQVSPPLPRWGCDPPLSFCPDELLTRDALRAALSRLEMALTEEAYAAVFGVDDDISIEVVHPGELADLLESLFGIEIPNE